MHRASPTSWCSFSSLVLERLLLPLRDVQTAERPYADDLPH